MKHLKLYEENIESETKKLYEELQFHHNKVDELDSKLAEICMKQIQPLLDSGRGHEAKKIHRQFYKFDVDDICFNKDLLLMRINKVIRIEDETDKYNL